MPGTAIYHILESLQYGFLYLVAAFVGGTALDFTFPHYRKNRPTMDVVREVVSQCLALVVVVILIRTIVQGIPFFWRGTAVAAGYRPYGTTEFNGEMMMGLVFLSSQLNLLAKIDDLSKRIYTAIFNEKRVVEHKFLEA